MKRLEGKVAAVFGGTGPLGIEVCRTFLAEGAKLVLGWYLDEEQAEAKKTLAAYEADCLERKVDTTSEDSVKQFVGAATERFGSIDVMLYMAGAFSVGPMIWETDGEVFGRMLDVNLKGAFYAAKHVVPVMLKKSEGRMFFFPAKSVVSPKPRFGAYAITKGGLLNLVESLAEELKETDITANAVMPDAVDTWKTRLVPHATPDKWIKPHQVADLLVGVCSMESNILNGSVLKVFGK